MFVALQGIAKEGRYRQMRKLIQKTVVGQTMSLLKSPLKGLLFTGALYAVLFATAGSALALDGGRLWKPYQPEEFGGGRRMNDGVYGELSAILWKVSKPKNLTSLSDSIKTNDFKPRFVSIMRFVLDDTVLSVRRRRNRHAQLLPAAEIQLTDIQLKLGTKIVPDKECDGMVVITAHDPERYGLCYAFNRKGSGGHNSKIGFSTAEKINLDTKGL